MHRTLDNAMMENVCKFIVDLGISHEPQDKMYLYLMRYISYATEMRIERREPINAYQFMRHEVETEIASSADELFDDVLNFTYIVNQIESSRYRLEDIWF